MLVGIEINSKKLMGRTAEILQVWVVEENSRASIGGGTRDRETLAILGIFDAIIAILLQYESPALCCSVGFALQAHRTKHTFEELPRRYLSQLEFVRIIRLDDIPYHILRCVIVLQRERILAREHTVGTSLNE